MSSDNAAASELPLCTICFEPVVENNGRSTAKLCCGHVFHLDCIGSEFNSKGSMKCPNCRQIEHGKWLFAAGGIEQSLDIARHEDYNVDDESEELLRMDMHHALVSEYMVNGFPASNAAPSETETSTSRLGPQQAFTPVMSFKIWGPRNNAPIVQTFTVINPQMMDNLPSPLSVQANSIAAHMTSSVAGPSTSATGTQNVPMAPLSEEATRDNVWSIQMQPPPQSSVGYFTGMLQGLEPEASLSDNEGEESEPRVRMYHFL